MFPGTGIYNFVNRPTLSTITGIRGEQAEGGDIERRTGPTSGQGGQRLLLHLPPHVLRLQHHLLALLDPRIALDI